MILNRNVKKKNFSIYDIVLGSSIVANVNSFLYIQQLNRRIDELIEKNKTLVASIDKLNLDITKIGDELLVMHSKPTTPILINASDNGFLGKALLVLGITVVGASTAYYLSSTLLAKVSSLSVSNWLTLPKFFSLGSAVANLPLNLPFIDKTKEITVFLQEVSSTIILELLNGEVSSINFRLVGDENTIPIVKALEAFLKLKKSQTGELSKTVSDESTVVAVETVAETLDHLSNLF